MRSDILLVLALLMGCAPQQGKSLEPSGTGRPPLSVIVLSETLGYRHGSISAGKAALTRLALENGWALELTEDSSRLLDLSGRHVVVFLHTTLDVLDTEQEASLRAFLEGGGGWVGLHSAADTEFDWPFFRDVVGEYFAGHPLIQQATVRVEDPQHPAARGVPTTWVRTDEWYNFVANPRPRVHVVMTVDESTYTGGTHGSDHPIAWWREVGEGRAFYTAMGHTDASFAEPEVLAHLKGAVEFAAGDR